MRYGYNKLPEGTVIINREIGKVDDQIGLIVKHDFELLIYPTEDGAMESHYFPMQDDKESHIIKQVVPHTHITAGFFSHRTYLLLGICQT